MYQPCKRLTCNHATGHVSTVIVNGNLIGQAAIGREKQKRRILTSDPAFQTDKVKNLTSVANLPSYGQVKPAGGV